MAFYRHFYFLFTYLIFFKKEYGHSLLRLLFVYHLQSWSKVLGTVMQYSYFSVIYGLPHKTVHPFRSFLAVLPPPHLIQN